MKKASARRPNSGTRSTSGGSNHLVFLITTALLSVSPLSTGCVGTFEDAIPDASFEVEQVMQGISDTSGWCYHPGGAATCRDLATSGVSRSDLELADFDGNGRSDVFQTRNGIWYVSYNGTNSWKEINNSSARLSSLAFGDFDGDGRDDVFNGNGSVWQFSSGGTSRWKTLRSASQTVSSLGFGDFDGDGITDVLVTTGSSWVYYPGGVGSGVKLNASSYTMKSLALADFNGNGITDVFRASGSAWYVSTDGRQGWRKLNTSSATLSSLRFADFNGDGKDDIFRSSGSAWYVSWGGTSSWRTLSNAGHSVKDLAFGDFDGDGRDDVFRARGAASSTESASSSTHRYPVTPVRVTSPYGNRYHPIDGIYKLHYGIDFAASYGQAIYATQSGTVNIASFLNSAAGYTVSINHGSGVQTRYKHLSRFNVSYGQRVSKGQVIGYIGTSGNSTAPHLHFEYLKDGKYRDPKEILP